MACGAGCCSGGLDCCQCCDASGSAALWQNRRACNCSRAASISARFARYRRYVRFHLRCWIGVCFLRLCYALPAGRFGRFAYWDQRGADGLWRDVHGVEPDIGLGCKPFWHEGADRVLSCSGGFAICAVHGGGIDTNRRLETDGRTILLARRHRNLCRVGQAGTEVDRGNIEHLGAV